MLDDNSKQNWRTPKAYAVEQIYLELNMFLSNPSK